MASLATDALHFTVDSAPVATSVHILIESLVNGVSPAPEPLEASSSLMVSAIKSAIMTRKGEILEAMLQFHYWLNIMVFTAIFYQELSKPGAPSQAALIREIVALVKLHPRTIEHYLCDGTIAAALSAAGSIYFVLLMSSGRVRADLRRIPADQLGRLSRALRSPGHDSAGKVICQEVIPAIAHLRQLFPLVLDSLFPPFFFEYYQFSTGQRLDCTNIIAFDKYISGAFVFNDFINDRDLEAWSPALAPLEDPQKWGLASLNKLLDVPITLGVDNKIPPIMSAPLVPQSPWVYAASVSSAHAIVIQTQFDPKAPENEKPPFHSGKSVEAQERLFHQTEKERTIATNAESLKRICDPASLKNSLAQSLKHGFRKNKKYYYRINSASHETQALRINDKDNNPLVISLPTMPDHLRCSLLDKIKLIFPESYFKDTDTAAEGINNTFSAIHFAYYNRYSEHGDKEDKVPTPVNVYPGSIVQLGKKRPINVSAKAPRTATELNLFSKEYVALQEALQPIFDWLTAQLKILLPEEYEILGAFVESLPYHASSPCYPFARFAFNFNVATRIHHDKKDQSLCLVLPFMDSDTEGGELAIYELGIVFGLRSFDSIFFRSKDLTHFNLHFWGIRGSLVFHSDGSGEKWVHDRNGWADNIYLRKTVIPEANENSDASDAEDEYEL